MESGNRSLLYSLSVARVSALRSHLRMVFAMHSSPVPQHPLSAYHGPESITGAGNTVADT